MRSKQSQRDKIKRGSGYSNSIEANSAYNNAVIQNDKPKNEPNKIIKKIAESLDAWHINKKLKNSRNTEVPNVIEKEITSIEIKKTPFQKQEAKTDLNKNKISEKIKRMEEDINRLKELCQQQNESISTIFKENKKHNQRSKSIDYNCDNYYTQTKKRNIDQRLYSCARVIFPNMNTSNKFNSMHRHITPDSIGLQNNRSQNLFKYNVKNIGSTRPYAEYHSLEKFPPSNLNNFNNFESLKKVKRKKKIKKKKIANLGSKIVSSINFNKFTISKPTKTDKNIHNPSSYRDSKISTIQLAKKLTSYDISMKKNIKRYTPACYQLGDTIEVKHLDVCNIPATTRHIYSNSNSKGSIGESSVNSNFGHKFETKTVTEEGTRETSCNKDSNLCLGSFEVIGYRDRMHFCDESQGLHTIKDKVVQTLNSYRSYCTSLQKEMMKLKIENQKLKDMLL